MCQRQALRCASHSLPSFAGGGKPKPPELGRCGLGGGDYGTSKIRENTTEERKTMLESGEYGGSKGGWLVVEEDVEVGWEGAWKGTLRGRRIRV